MISGIHVTKGRKGAVGWQRHRWQSPYALFADAEKSRFLMQTANGGGDATASFITNVTLVSIYPSPPPPLRQISYHSAIEQKAVERERGIEMDVTYASD